MISRPSFNKRRGRRSAGWSASRRTAPKLILVVFLVLGMYGLLGPRMFVVRRIDCAVRPRDGSGTSQCDDVVTAELLRYKGKSIFSLPTSAIEEKLLVAQRTIQFVSVSAHVPDLLSATLVPRIPVGQVITDQDAQQGMTVDGEGIILTQAQRRQDLTTIVWPDISNWSIEKTVPPEVLRAVGLVSLASGQLVLSRTPVVEADRSLALTLTSGTVVTFSLDKDPLAQLRSLQLVLDQARINGQPQFIDLRFSNPVVK